MSSRGRYECQLVNGLSGDPVIYAFSPANGHALFFDLGTISALSHKDILRVKSVLISHTHVDHFIGFDNLLRVNIPHYRHLQFFGPKGLAKNIKGKLQGYTWNLIEASQLSFEITEVHGAGLTTTYSITPDNEFEPVILGRDAVDNSSVTAVGTLPDQTKVLATPLDHGIPSICYALQTPEYHEVRIETLKERRLTPGPWIKSLQEAVQANRLQGDIIVEGRAFSKRTLADELLISHNRKPLGYVTDIVFSRQNLHAAKQVLAGVETLYCECNFAAEDQARALQKKHLTTKQAALLAAFVKAGQIQPFHISNLYHGRQQEIADEARSFFEAFQSMSDEELAVTVQQEDAAHHI